MAVFLMLKILHILTLNRVFIMYASLCILHQDVLQNFVMKLLSKVVVVVTHQIKFLKIHWFYQSFEIK